MQQRLTNKQKIEFRRSELADRINQITSLEGENYNDAIQLEERRLQVQHRELGQRYRSAVIAEGEESKETRSNGAGNLTSEQQERLELRSKSQVVNYVRSAIEMRSVNGPEAEYNAALGLSVDQFPLELLAPEKRQTTGEDVSTNQQTWLDRLFDQAAAQYLGVTFTSVAAGVSSHPVTTAGASAAAWTIGVTELRPKRNAVHAVFSIEDAARRGPGLEEALQRDLRMALVEGIDRAIFKGDAGPAGTGADIVGLQTAGISESTLTQANKLKADEILKLFAGFIDGKHATAPGDIRIVASVGTNTLWLTQVQAASVENQTVAQFLRASGINWTTRGNIDTNTSNGDFGAYVGLAQGSAGAAVAAVWESSSLIRDPYSGASKGEVSIVLNSLWDFQIPRTSNFKRVKYVS